MFGMVIEPYLKFYAVLSQSQCMTLRSRSQTLIFFVLNLYSVSCCKAFDLFESFGINGYKILKCFRKEKRVSCKLPCLATGLICFVMSRF